MTASAVASEMPGAQYTSTLKQRVHLHKPNTLLLALAFTSDVLSGGETKVESLAISLVVLDAALSPPLASPLRQSLVDHRSVR